MTTEERKTKANWEDDYGRQMMDVMSRTFALLLSHVQKSCPAAYDAMDKTLHLDVSDDPTFNAYFTNARYERKWLKSGQVETTYYHIHLFAGIPAALSQLHGLFRFIANIPDRSTWQTTPIPSEVTDGIRALFARWTEGHPPLLSEGAIEGVSPLSDTIILSAIGFTEAHEMGHFLMSFHQDIAKPWLEAAETSIASWLAHDCIAKPKPMAALRQMIAKPEVLAAWKRELAADMLAYQICGNIDPVMPKYGMAYANSILSATVAYALSRGIDIPETFPPCYARLMIVQEYVRRKTGKSHDTFQDTADWKEPFFIYTMTDRTLRQVLATLGKHKQ